MSASVDEFPAPHLGAVDAVERREAQIEALLEAVPDPLFAVDGDWRITLINRPAEAFFVRSRDELVGSVLWDVFPGARGTPTERFLLDAMEGGDPAGLELESISRPGRFIHLRPTRKATGGLALLFTDVTDQRAARARERAQAEEFRALADNIPALCWMTYADGHVYWFNSRWYDYTGATPDTQIGWGWGSVHDPEVLPAVEQRWRACLASGEPFEMTVSIRRHDGVFQPFLVRAAPVRDDAGAISRWFGSCTEVGEQIRQQQRLRTMVHELNHRVKNTLATVQSLAANSLRMAPDIQAGYKSFEARLLALSAAHDVLTEEKWEGADLAALVRSTLSPFSPRDEVRTTWRGPAVWLAPAAALNLSLIVHELATNAVKFGALSNASGAVVIDWGIAATPEGPRLSLRWLEQGGPPVEPPTTRGFGSRVIRRIARSEGGDARFAFDETGLAFTIDLPLKQEARGGADDI